MLKQNPPPQPKSGEKRPKKAQESLRKKVNFYFSAILNNKSSTSIACLSIKTVWLKKETKSDLVG